MKAIQSDVPQENTLDRAYEDAIAIRNRNAEIDDQRRRRKSVRRRIAEAVGREAPTEGKQRIPVDKDKVGILFVHGIGSQTPGETLNSWGASIVRDVVAWQDHEAKQARESAPEGAAPGATAPGRAAPGDPAVTLPDPVRRASLDFASGRNQYVEVDIPAVVRDGRVEHEKRRWVMTEVWWASSVSAPPLDVVLDWSTRQGVLGQVVRGIVNNGGGVERGALQRPARLGLTLFLSLASSVGTLAYLALRTIAAIVPIKALQEVAVFKAFDTFLLTWWGDAYLLLRDPIQSANVRAKIHKALLGLRAHGCGRIVIVAHSGGTMASYMTLGDSAYQFAGADAPDPAEDEDIDRANLPRVTKLITHGEAINLVRPFARGLYESADPVDGSMSERLDRLAPPLGWVGRWVDFWATHDPAPNGRLRPESEPKGTTNSRPGFASIKVWNRRSIREDHGMYMSNDEEFVMPLLRELDTPDTAIETSRFPEPDCESVNARRQRVHVLTLWRRVSFLAPFGAILAAVGLNIEQSGTDQLVALAGGAWTWVPSHAEIQRAVEGLVNAGPEWLWWLATWATILTLVVTTMGLAVHAVLPVRMSSVWAGRPWTRAGLVFLDWLPAIAAIALLVVYGLPLALGLLPEWRLEGLGNPLPLAAIGVAIVALGLMLRDDSASGADVAATAPRRPGLASRILSMLVLVALGGLLLLTLLAVVTLPPFRDLVLGAVLGFLVFRPLVGYGARRWERWDARERWSARHRRPRPNRKRVAVEAAVLLALAALSAYGLAVGRIGLPVVGETSFLVIPTVLFLAFILVTSLTDADRVEA